MSTVQLRDDQWLRMLQFLRSHPRAYVGAEESCRRFVEGVLWITRSGAQWRLLPAEYGEWNTVYKRFCRWCRHGIWADMHAHFSEDADMESVILDSTSIRAHPCAAGAPAKKGGNLAKV